jgi:hypothetical protein
LNYLVQIRAYRRSNLRQSTDHSHNSDTTDLNSTAQGQESLDLGTGNPDNYGEKSKERTTEEKSKSTIERIGWQAKDLPS